MLFLRIKRPFSAQPYAKSSVHRVEVPEDKVEWSTKWDDYSPPDYTSPGLKGKDYADDEIESGKFSWNGIDGKVDRRSHLGYFFLKL